MFGKLKDMGAKVQTGLEQAGSKSVQMIDNMRGVEKTLDQSFEIERTHYDNYKNSVQSMADNLKKHTHGVTSMCEGLKKFSNSLILFSGEDRRAVLSENLDVACEALSTSSKEYVIAESQFETKLKSITSIIETINKDIADRDRFSSEYDRNRFDLANEQKKPQQNATQIQLLQTRLDAAKTAYERRNEEVKQNIKVAYQNRNIHQEYQQTINAFAQFLQTNSQIFASFAAELSKTPAPPSY